MGSYDVRLKTSVSIFFLAFRFSSYLNLILISLNYSIRNAVTIAITGLFVANQNDFLITYLPLRCPFENVFSRTILFLRFYFGNPNNDDPLPFHPLKFICWEP